VGTSDEPERIEVELMSGQSPDSPFARPQVAAASGVSGDPGGGPDRRVVVIAAAVAVVALALGWVLGRSASGGIDDSVGAGEITAARTPVAPIDPADTPATTDDAATSTVASDTAAPAEMEPDASAEASAGDDTPSVGQVDVAASVMGQPVEIVTYGNGRQMLRLDLSTGTLVTQQVSRQPFGPPNLLIGDEWVMLPPPDPDLSTIVVVDDGTVTELPLGPIWQLAETADRTGLWVMSPELAAGGAGTIERMPISGGGVEELPLVGRPSRLDPRGGFVVDAPSGSYRVDADGVSQITTGELIAIGRDVALAEECDAALVCDVVVIERSNGARTKIDVARPLDDTFLTSIAIVGGESVSPDGALAMIRVVNASDRSSGQAVLGTVDLASGAFVEIGPAQDIDQTVWSPDSRFLFYNRGGKIVAYEPATGIGHVVAEALIAVDAFGVRAVSGRS